MARYRESARSMNAIFSLSDAVAVAPDGPSVASLIQMAIQEVLSGQVGGGPNLLLGNVTLVVMDTYATMAHAVYILCMDTLSNIVLDVLMALQPAERHE
jgi:hypothetical protein